MKLLFLNQFFYPDIAATSQYLTDVVRAVAPDHEATVICGGADYSDKGDSSPPPPARVIRVRNRHFGRRIRYRIASYVTFLAGACSQAFRQRPVDTVVTLTTPPFVALVGTLLKLTRGTRHVIWEMDVYPDIATGIGFLAPFTRFIRFTAMLSRFIHRNADEIIVLGECMRQRLIRNGVDPRKIHIAENWADGAEIHPLPFPAPDQLTLHYSGNFGRAHDFETISTAILGLRRDPRFHFIFAGGGPNLARLESMVDEHNVHNVTFRSYCERSQLSEHLSEGHIGLITQHPGSLGAVVPSKLYGIMAAGRPVLYIGPAGSTTAAVIQSQECGWHIEPGDTVGLIALLYRLAYDPAEIQRCGSRARAAFEAHYDRPLGVARITKVIAAVSPTAAAQEKVAGAPKSKTAMAGAD